MNFPQKKCKQQLQIKDMNFPQKEKQSTCNSSNRILTNSKCKSSEQFYSAQASKIGKYLVNGNSTTVLVAVEYVLTSIIFSLIQS